MSEQLELFEKFDQEKAPLSNLGEFYPTIEQVSKALKAGADKYGDKNWKRCDNVNRYYSAALRHTFASLQGEEKDPETGLSHLAHAMVNMLFIEGLIREREEFEHANQDMNLDDLIMNNPNVAFTVTMNGREYDGIYF